MCHHNSCRCKQIGNHRIGRMWSVRNVHLQGGRWMDADTSCGEIQSRTPANLAAGRLHARAPTAYVDCSPRHRQAVTHRHQPTPWPYRIRRPRVPWPPRVVGPYRSRETLGYLGPSEPRLHLGPLRGRVRPDQIRCPRRLSATTSTHRLPATIAALASAKISRAQASEPVALHTGFACASNIQKARIATNECARWCRSPPTQRLVAASAGSSAERPPPRRPAKYASAESRD